MGTKKNTVIFDIGNVLAPFDWRTVYETLFPQPLWEPLSDATVRQTDLWDELDKGRFAFPVLLEKFVARTPHLETEIRQAIPAIYKNISPFPYATHWVKSLKDRGLKVYLLSNYGDLPYQLSLPRFAFADLVDGAVISYEIKTTKPDPAIYQFLFEKYNINPAQAVFLDDNAANVATARTLGLSAILFQTKAQAEPLLEALLAD